MRLGRMRNAECGMRNVTAGVVPLGLPQLHDPPLQFRTPHSAFRIWGWAAR
jgi:hypothetical protein